MAIIIAISYAATAKSNGKIKCKNIRQIECKEILLRDFKRSSVILSRYQRFITKILNSLLAKKFTRSSVISNFPRKLKEINYLNDYYRVNEELHCKFLSASLYIGLKLMILNLKQKTENRAV